MLSVSQLHAGGTMGSSYSPTFSESDSSSWYQRLRTSVVIGLLALALPCIAFGSPFYSYRLMAFTGSGLLNAIDSEVSINNKGAVAFVGFVPSGQAIFVADDTSVTNFTPSAVRPTVSFAPAVMLNNNNVVVGRELVAGAAGLPPHAFVRVWDGASSFLEIVSAGWPGEPFAAVQNRAAINDTGEVVFVGSDPGAPTQFRLATPTVSGYNRSAPLPLPLRPRISNNGTVVVAAGGILRLYDSTLTSAQAIASAPDFTAIGRSPGISDNGQIVTFYGELSAAGAVSNGTNQGPGLFASIDMGTGTRQIVRIAGRAGDNLTFDPNSVVAVNSTQQTQRAVTVVYVATDMTSGKKGIYSARLNFFGSNLAGAPVFSSDMPQAFSVAQRAVVISEGDIIAGLSGTVQSFNIFDPVNDRDRGDIAFWVQTTTGQQAVIRARYQQLVFLDFDPHSNFAASGGTIGTNTLTRALPGVPAGWALGNMQGVLTSIAPGRGFNVVDIQNNIVNLVQESFSDLVPAPGVPPLGVNVRVIGRVGEGPPPDGPFIRVFIGDGPFGRANCTAVHNENCGLAGVASTIDLFNQFSLPEDWDLNGNGIIDIVDYKNKPVLVFVDNIFRVSDYVSADGQPDAMFYDPPFIPPVGVLRGIPVSLNTMGGAGEITQEQVERAIASTIAHEVGHVAGLLHIDNSQNTLVMNAEVTPNELRFVQNFGNAGIIRPRVPGDLENSGARLAFSFGSDVEASTLHRDPPSAGVLAARARSTYRIAALAPSVPIAVTRAFIGIASPEHHVLPQLVDLGTGDLATLLNQEISVSVGDRVLLLASTNGNTIDIFSVDAAMVGQVDSIDLSSALLVMTDARLQGKLFDTGGLPLAMPELAVYRLTASGPLLISGSGPAFVTVPNLAGLTQSVAVSTLTSAGLVVGTISTQHSGTVPAGFVIAQTPAANASVAPRTAVQLLVSLGPSIRGDINGDGSVDQDDLKIILAARNTIVAPGDPRDLDGDGKVTALDARILTILCTRPRCATK